MTKQVTFGSAKEARLINTDDYGFVYEVTDLINGKTYIGKRLVDEKGDWRYYPTSSKYIKAQIKLRPKDFRYTILAVCNDETALKMMEALYIFQRMSFDPFFGHNANIVLNIRRQIDMSKRYRILTVKGA